MIWLVSAGCLPWALPGPPAPQSRWGPAHPCPYFCPQQTRFPPRHALPTLEFLWFSLSAVSNSLWPRGLQHTRFPYPSPSSRVRSNSCLLSWWCHPTISSSVVPFSSCPESFSASGSLFILHQPFYWVPVGKECYSKWSEVDTMFPNYLFLQTKLRWTLTGICGRVSKVGGQDLFHHLIHSLVSKKGSEGHRVRPSTPSVSLPDPHQRFSNLHTLNSNSTHVCMCVCFLSDPL